ncbi:MAG: type II secretion system protein [Armatimonadetes bacterium]|nr:hypothetical protein [Armatimonadota bacterium]MBS1700657.1 type II secretion system protein [Armatimonadota bacterium]MBS1728854.1 type II secretion system protein [Armatimonadota bacterium]
MGKSGFTLIETLFSIMFVGCAAAIAVVSMPASTASKTKAKYYNFAVNYATRQIEELQYRGFAKLNADDLKTAGLIDSKTPVAGTDTYPCTNVSFGANELISSKLPNGKATVRIQDVTMDSKRVTVHVEWLERSQTRSFDLGTVVADL